MKFGEEKMAGSGIRLFAGIDGGGTKTALSVLDERGRIVFSNTSGPSSLLSGTEFEDTLLKMLREMFSGIKTDFGKKIYVDINAGFAGTSSEDFEKRFRDVFRTASIGTDYSLGKLRITSDALLALNVYFSDKPGLLLISGTGSICYGKDKEGRLYRTGGFGYLIDDAGSGYWIGKEGIKAALESYYHYKSGSELEELVIRHFGLGSAEDIFGLIYRGDSKSKIASVSEVVFRAAGSGCAKAEEILKRAADELLKLVRNCYDLIGGNASFVVLHGSVLRQDILINIIKNALMDDLNIYVSDKRIDLEAASIMLDQKDV